MSKSKAFLIILGIVIVLLAAIGILYYYLFSGSPATTPQGGSTTTINPSRPVVIPPQGGSTASTTAQTTPNGAVPRLRKISNTAVAGDVMFDLATTTVGADGKKQTVTTTMIRYMERATGHTFETKTSALAVNRLSTTDILGADEAFWTGDGSSVYTRYVDQSGVIDTYFGTLKAIKAPGTGTSSATSSASSAAAAGISYAPMALQGSFFPNGILALTLSPAKDSLFYILPTAGSGQGIISKLDGSQKTQILSSPISEWTALWVAPKVISLASKPSASVSGYLYLLGTDTGLLSKVAGDIPGLTALVSPDAKTALLAGEQNNSIGTALYSIASHLSRAFPAKTLPEKCVWSSQDVVIYCAVPENMPSGAYPDDWYQGAVSFSDDIWSINSLTGTSTIVAKPNDLVGTAIDATKLSLDAKENYLTFINKKDGLLWGLNLAQQQ